MIAVEANPAAARDLETNARGPGTIEVRRSDVERFLERFKEKPEFVVLDPPRDGMSRPAVEKLAKMQPARITYVSCEPPTLARDLAVLGAGRLRNRRHESLRFISTNISHGGGDPASPARMKLPALWIARRFCGRHLRWTAMARISRWFALQPRLLRSSQVAFSFGAVYCARAAICALAAWIALGGLALGIEQCRRAGESRHAIDCCESHRSDRTAALARTTARRSAPDALGPAIRNRYRTSGDPGETDSHGERRTSRKYLQWAESNRSSLAEGLRAGDRVEALVRAGRHEISSTLARLTFTAISRDKRSI